MRSGDKYGPQQQQETNEHFNYGLRESIYKINIVQNFKKCLELDTKLHVSINL